MGLQKWVDYFVFIQNFLNITIMALFFSVSFLFLNKIYISDILNFTPKRREKLHKYVRKKTNSWKMFFSNITKLLSGQT